MGQNKQHILVVDDEDSMREVISIILRRGGFHCEVAEGIERAKEFLTQHSFDAVVTDLVMDNDQDAGMKLLEWIKENMPQLPTIMITAYGSVENATEAMKAGAADYVQKPFKSNDEIVLRVKKAIEQQNLKKENEALYRERASIKPYNELIGNSPVIENIKKMIRNVAQLPSTVVIYGESGVGKDLVARAIHWLSPRADKPFIAINCASIPETLLESELFGYKRGAFTGAMEDKEGLFVAANGGTVFLDEIGEMPLNLQARLLRVLDHSTITPVGETKEIKVDIRVISATNKNLEEMVVKGLFRDDLFFRLNVIPIRIPPLREHKEDIPLLVHHFIKLHSSRMGLPIPTISPEVMTLLMNYSWPGNVRELSHTIEQILALSHEPEINLTHIPDSLLKTDYLLSAIREKKSVEFFELPPEGIRLEDFIEKIEKKLIEQALVRAKYSQKQAAKILGLTPRSLRYRLQKYGFVSEEENNEE